MSAFKITFVYRNPAAKEEKRIIRRVLNVDKAQVAVIPVLDMGVWFDEDVPAGYELISIYILAKSTNDGSNYMDK